jgi:hypothetical protein
VTALSMHATQRELSFPNAVGQLDSGDHHGRRPECFQAVHDRAASLDGTIILLDDVIEVFAGAHLDLSPEHALTPQQP